MECLNSFFKEFKEIRGESSYFKTSSNSQRLDVCLSSIHPTFQITFKLTDFDHIQAQCVQFTQNTWEEIVKKNFCIKTHLSIETERAFFTNQEVKVFSEKIDDKCAVCFLDTRGQRVNMILPTFVEMLNFLDDSALRLLREVKRTAKSLESFCGFMITTCDQLNVDNARLKEYLISIQAYLNGICEVKEPCVEDLYLNYVENGERPYDFGSEEEYYRADDDENCTCDDSCAVCECYPE